ncbi:MAG: hypothetical protein SFX18_01135 [Pirellulales bacterium]|nr:hypothetical protein [Pirellulales bacterium]
MQKLTNSSWAGYGKSLTLAAVVGICGTNCWLPPSVQSAEPAATTPPSVLKAPIAQQSATPPRAATTVAPSNTKSQATAKAPATAKAAPAKPAPVIKPPAKSTTRAGSAQTNNNQPKSAQPRGAQPSNAKATNAKAGSAATGKNSPTAAKPAPSPQPATAATTKPAPAAPTSTAQPTTPSTTSAAKAGAATPVTQSTTNSSTAAGSVSAAAGQPAKVEKYTLQYKFTAGEVVRTRLTQQTRVETTISGTSQVAEIATVSDKRWKVIAVDEAGNVTFETMWDAIDMRQKMSGREEVRYNSRTDKTPPPGYESTAAMIGTPLSRLTIDRTGKVLKRESTSEQSAKIHDSGTYQAHQQVLVPLPAQPVHLGQPWSTPIEITVTVADQPRVYQARHRYQLDKVEGGIASISYETVLPPIDNPEIRSQVIQNLGRGTIEFDLRAGRIIKQVTNVDERVVGFHGHDSSIYFLSKFAEESLTEEKQPSVAQKTR